MTLGQKIKYYREKQEEVLFHDSTRKRIEKYEKLKVEPIGKKRK